MEAIAHLYKPPELPDFLAPSHDRVPSLRRPAGQSFGYASVPTKKGKELAAAELEPQDRIEHGVVRPLAAVGTKVSLETPAGRPLMSGAAPTVKQPVITPGTPQAHSRPDTAKSEGVSSQLPPSRQGVGGTGGVLSIPVQRPKVGLPQELSWGEKYRFFSGSHMRSSYKTYARARSDPFNKDPSWGKSIISRVANTCNAQNIEPHRMFDGFDATGRGDLNRGEVRRALITVLPDLSDMEVAAIFDVIDEDGSGEVSVGEFCEAIAKAKVGGPVDESEANRWRNPIHRIKRIAPARIEGWDHLVDEPIKASSLQQLCTGQLEEIASRLRQVLPKTPRTPRTPRSAERTTKYSNFSGGCERFRRLDHTRSNEQHQQIVTDPGGSELRPGFLCDTSGRQVARSFGLSMMR